MDSLIQNRRWCCVVLVLVLMAFTGACDSPDSFPSPVVTQNADSMKTAAGPTSLALEDITVESGITFLHEAGPVGEYFFPQAAGSGAAIFDLEGDGDLDILLLQGDSSIPTENTSHALGTLYRQDETGRFVDVTHGSGLVGKGYGMGVAVGDINNDGYPDLYLTRFGPDQLFRNNGDGTFTDITAAAKIENLGWGTAAAMIDMNRDGWLDLVVANYVEYVPGSVCHDGAGRREFCGPKDFQGNAVRLFLNQGFGPSPPNVTYQDVTVSRKLTAKLGKGLGIVVRDFDQDGRTDIFVANDGMENFLWMQQPDGTFREEALERGVAVNQRGAPEANMGVVCDDLNSDGLFDIFVTHLCTETNTLWMGLPHGQFEDMTPQSGLGNRARGTTGFGNAALDLDLNGDLDLLVANGHVTRSSHGPAHTRSPTEFWQDYADVNQLFMGIGGGEFSLAQELGGSFSHGRAVSRGLAIGDIDRDGSPDVLVTQVAGPAHLYRNVCPRKGKWLAVRTIDPALKRDMLGSRVSVRAGMRWFHRENLPHTGYLCSHEPTLFFGIGSPADYDEIIVEWPDRESTRERFPGGSANKSLTLLKGRGERLERFAE